MTKSPSLFSNVQGDFFGGLTAGIVALPLALAFSAQTELGAIAGLYGAIVVAVLAAVFIKHLDGPLFFGFATRFQELVQQLGDLEFVVLRMERVPYVDQSGLYALEEAIHSLHAQDVTVLLTGLHGQPADLLSTIAISPGLVPDDHSFEDFHAAAHWLREALSQSDAEDAAVAGNSPPQIA